MKAPRSYRDYCITLSRMFAGDCRSSLETTLIVAVNFFIRKEEGGLVGFEMPKNV